MGKTMLVKALKAHRYGGAQRRPGEVFPIDPKLLVAGRAMGLYVEHALEVDAPSAAPVYVVASEQAEPVRVKRRYRRRDQTAEPA
jgi:hypothetical protein